MMVRDMLESVAVFGIVEALIFDAPAALAKLIQTGGTQAADGNVREPIAFPHLPRGIMNPVAEHPHGHPAQLIPRIEVIGIPEFHPGFLFFKHPVSGGVFKPSLGLGIKSGEIVFQGGGYVQTQIVGFVQGRSIGIEAVPHHILGKTGA